MRPLRTSRTKQGVQHEPRTDTDGLTPRERAFCLAYVGNGFVGSSAYSTAHPQASSSTARSEAVGYLAKPSVRRFLNRELAKYFGRLEASGSEMLGRLVQNARSDIREAFGADGEMLHPKDWPDDFASSVEACEVRADGSIKIKLVSKLQARRLLLEVTGMVKNPAGEAMSALARAIRGDLGLPATDTVQ